MFLKNGTADFSEPVLKKMMRHRGRDGFGHYAFDNFCMAVSTHRVIGMGNAVQPFESADGRFVLAGNGDIYNYKEIGCKLFPAKDSPALSYDLAVALEAFKRYGLSAFDMLRGPFALVIWDNLKKELWIARDRLGERTLYHYSDECFDFFSSEMRIVEAFVKFNGKQLELSKPEIAKTIGAGRMGNDERTLFRSVKEIPPGTVLNISAKKITTHKIKFQSQGLVSTSVAENSHALLDQALKRVFTADTGFSLAFSGGIDSSFILDYALKWGINLCPVVTLYSAGHEAQDKNFTRSRDLAGYLGIDVDYIPFEPPGFWEVADILGNFFDGPVTEAIGLHNHVLHNYAGKKSKVLIGGHGADEAFGGYNRYRQILQRLEATGKHYSAKELISIADQLDWRRFSRTLNWRTMLQGIIHPDELMQLPADEHVFLHSIGADSRDAVCIAQLIDINLQYYDNFRITDENGICNGVEVRSPFFDIDLLDYIFSLPLHERLKSNQPKFLLQNAFHNKAILEFLQKSKVGFDDFFQYRNWVSGNKEIIEEFIFDGPLRKAGLLDKNFKRNIGGLINTNWGIVWRLFAVSVWLEKN